MTNSARSALLTASSNTCGSDAVALSLTIELSASGNNPSRLDRHK